MLKVSTFRFDAFLQSFSEDQDGFLDRILWEVVPDRLQHFSQFRDELKLRHTLLVSVYCRSPDMKVEQIKIWGVGRPLVLPDEVRRVLLQPILRRSTVLLKCVAIRHQEFTVVNQGRQELADVIVGVKLGLVGDEMKTSCAVETNAR